MSLDPPVHTHHHGGCKGAKVGKGDDSSVKMQPKVGELREGEGKNQQQ